MEKGGFAGDGKGAVGGGKEGYGEGERERRRLDVEWEGMWEG